jgi:hypothetical protein
MPVYFPSYSNVDLNTIRYAMGLVTNATGPDRYESGDLNRIGNLAGGRKALSDYVGLNFYAFCIMYQGEGYIYDGCQGRDHWCYYDGTDEYGGYVGPFGGGSTYCTERGYNNGNFLTFGYGYAYTYFRPYSYHTYISYSSNDYNCRAFYVDILRNGSVVTGNYFAYAGGGQYAQYTFDQGLQGSESITCRLILWY